MKDEHTPNITPQTDELRQARQLARRRKRRRLMIRRTIIVLSLLLIVLAIVAAVVVKIVADQKSAKGEKVGFLAVKEILVEGDTRYTDEEIIKASGLYVGQSLLSVNKVQAHDALTATFPYLNTIEVSNASFYTLRIRLTEVPVMAAVEVEDGWMILGDNNRAMELVTADKIPAGTVCIRGASFEEKVVGKSLLDERSLRICRSLLEASRQYGLSNMTTIDVSVKTKISILLNEQMQVVLGTETNLSNQVKALVDILPTLYKNNGENAAGRLNMLFYNDSDKKNDKAIYTPEEVLAALQQTEQKPMAAVQIDGGWMTVSTDNIGLEIVPEEHLPEGLVQVVGADCENPAVGKELLEKRILDIVNAILEGDAIHEKVHLVTMDITDRTAITLHLAEGLQVLLGDTSTLSTQMDALAGVLPSVWEEHGEEADGLLDITSYGDESDDNDEAIYTPKSE